MHCLKNALGFYKNHEIRQVMVMINVRDWLVLSFTWLPQDLPKLVSQPVNQHCLHHLLCDGLCKVVVGILL